MTPGRREHDNEPEPDEGGDAWTQQHGYGERVLDPDERGDEADAAEDQADAADTVEDHR